jgi:hypothetical protein
MKKIILGLFGLCLLGVVAQAQSGLDGSGVIVEKYYKANAADAAGSAGTLPEGSVTWRIYIDMKPGYKLQTIYGKPVNPLNFSTTTSFFNNTDRGATTPTYTRAQAKSNTAMLDSWLTVGAAAAGKEFGVLKSEDDAVNNIVNANGLLANTAAEIGIPLTSRDGIMTMATAPLPVTFVGISPDDMHALDATSQEGNTFDVINGAWAALGGAVGATASNTVLIAQITTDGDFHFNFSFQIGTPSGGTEAYTYGTPTTATEYVLAACSQTLTPGLKKPIVDAITAPANGANIINGDVVALAATAHDADGTVSQVQFFVDGISVGVDATAPYTASYTANVNGDHTITAIATDNDGLTSVAIPGVLIHVAANQAPVVAISAPATSVVGDVVAISATATDIDGTVASVVFKVDGVTIGTVVSTPFTASYVGVAGTHSLTATATDNRGATSTSTTSLLVKSNTPPTVSITDPINGQNKTINTIVAISATAADIDGTVASVEFKVNGLSIGVVNAAPFTVNWTPTAEGSTEISAISTDNKGATSPEAKINVVISDPNALPYEVSPVVQTCLPSSVCIPVVSKKATMAGVIGYDVVMNYDKSRVIPTGNITVSNALIDATKTTYTTNIDSANSLMHVTIYFNGTATATTNFQGEGELFCAEFNKTAAFKSYDTALFSVSKLEESYATSVVAKLTKSGSFRTYKDSTFYGSLKFWSDNSPIKYDLANPNDYLVSNIVGCSKLKSATNNVVPDLNGNFVYNIWNGTSLSVNRDILPTTDVQNVIANTDAYYTAIIAAENTKVFTPTVFQAIAMDVNGDGQISAGDASQIALRSIGAIAEFKQVWNASNGKPSKDWYFVNTPTLAGAAFQISTTYPKNDGNGFSKYKVPVVDTCQSVPVPDLSCPLISSDVYTGILLGDVNASYAGILHDGLLKSGKVSENSIIIDLSKAVEVNGNLNIPVSLVTSLNVANTSVNVFKPESELKIITFAKDEKSLPNSNLLMLSLSSKNGEAITANDLSDGNLVKINDVIAKLKVIDATTSVNELNGLSSVSIYPNPASEQLKVVASEIFNLSGKMVLQSVNAQQSHVMNVNQLAAGVYMVKVFNNNFVKNSSVVIK